MQQHMNNMQYTNGMQWPALQTQNISYGLSYLYYTLSFYQYLYQSLISYYLTIYFPFTNDIPTLNQIS